MKKMPSIPAADNTEFTLFANIHARVETARCTVARGVDLVQVHTNFEIGRHIVEFEQQGDRPGSDSDALLALLAKVLPPQDDLFAGDVA